MAITYDMVKSVSAQLYESCLKKIPEDTRDALARAANAESNDGARKILAMMLKAPTRPRAKQSPCLFRRRRAVYFVKIGTAAKLDGAIKARNGFVMD